MKENWQRIVNTLRNMGGRRSTRKGVERYLIVGLGNPGSKYEKTRHNIGFMSIDHLADQHSIDLRRIKHKARYGEGTIKGHRVILAKPQTFMNSSGEAVAPLSRYFKIPPERILIVYDDLDLPFARLRVRPYGSSGGHNGLKSIIAQTGSDQFVRVRVGIGRPTHGRDPIDYVLERFDRDQEPIVPAICERVDEIVCFWLDNGAKETMNTYNNKAMSQLVD